MICNCIEDCMVHIKDSNQRIQRDKCPNDSSQCIQSTDNRSKIVCRENRACYTLENTKQKIIVSYCVDGGIIKNDKDVEDNISKCDYLYAEIEKNYAILIELKGKNVSHALEQLLNTLGILNKFLSYYEHVYARVVFSKGTPNLQASSSYVKLYKKIKKMNGNIKVHEKNLNERDTQLVKE